MHPLPESKIMTAQGNRYVFLTAILAILAGTMVLFGWALDIAVLKSISPNWVSMKPNTAICFILTGFALLLIVRPPVAVNPRYAMTFLRLAQLCGLLAGLIGLLTLSEYIFGLDLGIDNRLFPELAGTVGTSHPGRMAPETALNFVFLALALWLVAASRPTRRSLLISASLGMLVATLGLTAALSYLTPSLGAFGWFGLTIVAMHTAILFALLGTTIISISWQPNVLLWSLNKRTTLAFACAMAVMVFIGFTSSRSHFWAQHMNQHIAHDEKVLGEFATLLIEIIDAQAHVRGYVITGDAEFKKHFEDAKTSSSERLSSLQTLVVGYPIQQQHLAHIKIPIKAELQWLQRVIDTDRASMTAAAKTKMPLHGEALMSDLRITFEQIEIEDRQHIQQLKDDGIIVSQFAYIFIFSGTLASLLISLVVVFRLNSENMLRSITEKKNLRLTNLYAALSQCNQAIIHCTNKEELFQQICRDAVRFGGMKMAWVGQVDEASKQVKQVTSAGEGVEYLDGIIISTDAAIPTGRGPSGTAVRENRPFWCQDFQHDSSTAPWHEQGVHAGWGSLAALPLNQNGKTVGVFTLYAAEMNAFDKEARELLTEMAMDISFALDNFAREAERQSALAELSKNQALLAKAEHIAHLGAWAIELPEMRVVWSDEVCLLHDMPLDTQPTLEQGINFYAPESIDKIKKVVGNAISDGTPFDVELQIITAKQRRVWMRVIGEAERDNDGKIIRVQGTFQDINEIKLAQAQIEHLVHYDTLTGLPNRTFLEDRITSAITHAKRYSRFIGVMFINLTHFHSVNELFGHEGGDAILMTVAERLVEVVPAHATVSRLSADTFVIALPDLNETKELNRTAELIEQRLRQPFSVASQQINLSARIGISVYPDDGNDAITLIKCADTALSNAKKSSEGISTQFYSPSMNEHARHLVLMGNELRNAIEQDRLVLFYQPQVDIVTGHIIGAEALIRLNHAERGIISPGEFISVAEETGLIVPMGNWVIHEASRQMKQWHDESHTDLVIAVNLSPLQLRQSSLTETIKHALDESGLPPQNLELEFTESAIMQNVKETVAIMRQFKAMGLHLSIDDFGTGYSSLSYLKQFPVDKLKIDQSFVSNIAQDPHGTRLRF